MPVVEISQLSKEYLNTEDGLVIVDKKGFEILDNPSTWGSNVEIISRNYGAKSYLHVKKQKKFKSKEAIEDYKHTLDESKTLKTALRLDKLKISVGPSPG